MIQGHAYDGWVSDEHKASAAYGLTRLLGSLPLPAFLVLAGAAVALRIERGLETGEPTASVRRSVITRGLEVVAWGYATNVAYALLDGFDSADTILRADVLHVIGLSIAIFAALAIRGTPASRPRAILAWSAGLFVVPTLSCPWLSPLGGSLNGPWRVIVGLFVDVPSVTRMPFVPLVAWFALGVFVTALIRRTAGARAAIAGGSDRVLLALGALALLVAVLAARGTEAWVEQSGAALSRAHPAVWLNVIDLGARGLLVLAVAALLSPRLPSLSSRLLVRLGQGSLYAYIAHIPFCYGRLAAPIRGRLTMSQASAMLVALTLLSYAAVRLRDGLRPRPGTPTGQ